ncbi:HupE/UreJ family protein [Tropicimonas aquimaris]|uniref:HupE/UreJ family protein n=1 Tax=Tropicimonas aquimaris TaxID=914152 RepID=A0ABW3IWV7_9RHOB
MCEVQTAPVRWVRQMLFLWALTALCVISGASASQAHARDENYVWINVETDRLSGRFEIAFDDLRDRLGIAIPEEQDAREAAVRENAAEIQRYIDENFDFLIDGAELQVIFGEAGLAPGAETRFASFAFETAPIDPPDQIEIRNEILLSWESPLYRSLIVAEYDRKRGLTHPQDHVVQVYGPNKTLQTLDFTNLETILTPREFVWQGILHVIAGPDHVLFLAALLLSAVMRMAPPRHWEPAEGMGKVAWNAFWVITLFAVAHSATLALTVLGILQPNIQLIESLIALSIVVVALNNLFPVLDSGRWLMIVFFGLFHGMGFASAMSDLQFRLVEPVKILLNFNVGIEIGQLIILFLLLPLFYMIRKTAFFRRWIFQGGSLVIAAIAGYWTIIRGLGL